MNKGLVKLYTEKDIKHKNDSSHGILYNNVGIIISILFSLTVQTDDKVVF